MANSRKDRWENFWHDSPQWYDYLALGIAIGAALAVGAYLIGQHVHIT